ncbi:hypothetical protein [Arsenophonus endosymbiont of Bemisia tabaci]|uniref:hypothetical protein n=1 Tax=Arsenophonus endosymbiont of Bemisia tabaci TaxID=536059 RepID=UPI0015F3AE34|nr:hypothetical protein [Arsenophonus endosymbiont of Bemisia tabaci]
MQKKSARMLHRYFVRTQYGVIKIKSLSYSATKLVAHTVIKTFCRADQMGNKWNITDNINPLL